MVWLSSTTSTRTSSSTGGGTIERLAFFAAETFQLDGEMKCAAAARFAFDPDAAAHQLHQLGRNAQPQPGAAVSASRRTIRLRECFENALLLSRRYANAGVSNRELQETGMGQWSGDQDQESETGTAGSAGLPIALSPELRFRTDLIASTPALLIPQTADSVTETTSPRSVNFTALPTRFRMIWRRRTGSPTKSVGNVGGNVANQFQPLLVRSQRQSSNDAGNGVAQGEVRRFDVEFARLDLREVQDVIDETEQGVCRRLHSLEVFVRWSFVKFGVEGETGHTEDSVHGRADLVPHVGEEIRSLERPRGGICPGLR